MVGIFRYSYVSHILKQIEQNKGRTPGSVGFISRQINLIRWVMGFVAQIFNYSMKKCCATGGLVFYFPTGSRGFVMQIYFLPHINVLS